MPSWTPIFALPNLSIDEPIEGPGIAVLPLGDPRIQGAFAARPSLRQFFARFTTPTGGQIAPPTIAVERTDRPTLEEVVAFRNAATISLLTRGWADQVAARQAVWVPLYSNALDLYPGMLARDGTGIIWATATTYGWDDISAFSGQCSPQFPHPSHFTARVDEFLFRGLMRAWERRFIQRRQERWTARLFRALQMAYRATETPSANKGMAIDWGTGASLWVSAFEVLSHPGRGGRVGFPEVADALECAPWFDPHIALHRRHRVVHGRGSKRREWRSMAAGAYLRVYDLRNHVLHGEQLPRRGLNNYLPLSVLLFRGLLLGELQAKSMVQRPRGDLSAAVVHRVQERRYEDALRSIVVRVRRCSNTR